MKVLESFRIEAARKFLTRGRGKHETIRVAEEIGVTVRTLQIWVHKYGMASEMPKSKRRPQDWGPSEKLKAVIEFEGLPEDQRGEFLRRKGLQSEHLELWKQGMQKGLERSSTQDNKGASSEDKRKIKELEKALAQKDKVIAETTALLVLKKKANLIWGTGEDK